MKIVPVSWPYVNWDNFVTCSNELLNRSPTRALDRAGIRVGDLSSFIASVGAFNDANVDPFQYIKYTYTALRFLHFTFLCQFDQVQHLIGRTPLTLLLSENDTFLLSGTLLDYKNEIIEKSYDNNLRIFFNALYTFFKANRLEEIWSTYTKVILEDGSWQFK